MPPAKSKANHEDSKSETPNHKDKTGHGTTVQHSNGKSRRVASAAASQLREVTTASALPTPSVAPKAAAPGLDWASFERSTLHSYRRVHGLNSSTAFQHESYRWVLSRPGGIGLQSPTMARRKDSRRQSKEKLANDVRKHFNNLGVQENDVIVDFMLKSRSQGVSKPERPKRADRPGQSTDR